MRRGRWALALGLGTFFGMRICVAEDANGAAMKSFPPVDAQAAPGPAASAAPPATPLVSPPAPVVSSPAQPAPGLPTVLAMPAATAPSPAAAAPGPAPAPPRAQRGWDLGVGVSLVSASDVTTLGALFTPSVPSFRTSLERRLGAATWLGLTGLVSYSASTMPVSSSQLPPERSHLDYSSNTLAAVLGLRQILVHDVVDLSVYGAFGFARVRFAGDALQPGESSSQPAPGSKASAWIGSGGLTLERELVEALALRLSCDVASVSHSRLSLVTSGDRPAQDTHSTGFQLRLAPAVDLRFYF